MHHVSINQPVFSPFQLPVNYSGLISCHVTGGPGLKIIFRSICCLIVIKTAFTHLLFFITANETIHFLILAANRLVLTLACRPKLCSAKCLINEIITFVIRGLNSGIYCLFLHPKPSSWFCLFVFPAFLCLPLHRHAISFVLQNHLQATLMSETLAATWSKFKSASAGGG